MIVQGILKLSLENVHIIEIWVKIRIQNSIKKLLPSGLKYVLKNRSVFCAEPWWQKYNTLLFLKLVRRKCKKI